MATAVGVGRGGADDREPSRAASLHAGADAQRGEGDAAVLGLCRAQRPGPRVRPAARRRRRAERRGRRGAGARRSTPPRSPAATGCSRSRCRGPSIGGENMSWSQAVIWGNAVIWGSGTLPMSQTAWGNAVIWGSTTNWANASAVIWGSNVVWTDPAVVGQRGHLGLRLHRHDRRHRGHLGQHRRHDRAEHRVEGHRAGGHGGSVGSGRSGGSGGSGGELISVRPSCRGIQGRAGADRHAPSHVCTQRPRDRPACSAFSSVATGRLQQPVMATPDQSPHGVAAPGARPRPDSADRRSAVRRHGSRAAARRRAGIRAPLLRTRSEAEAAADRIRPALILQDLVHAGRGRTGAGAGLPRQRAVHGPDTRHRALGQRRRGARARGRSRRAPPTIS